MQVMRSCSSLLQDHFPNRLGCLLVIRLPPVVRVITQTFIQVSLLLWLGFNLFILSSSFLLLFSLSPLHRPFLPLFFLFWLVLVAFSASLICPALSDFETCHSEEGQNRRGHVPQGSLRVPSGSPYFSWWQLYMYKMLKKEPSWYTATSCKRHQHYKTLCRC